MRGGRWLFPLSIPSLALFLAACTVPGSGSPLPAASVSSVTPRVVMQEGDLVTINGANLFTVRGGSGFARELSVSVCGVPLRDVRVIGEERTAVVPPAGAVTLRLGDRITGVMPAFATTGTGDVLVNLPDGQELWLEGAVDCHDLSPSVGSFDVSSADPVAGQPVTFTWSVSSPFGAALACALDPGDGSAPLSIGDCQATTSVSLAYARGGHVEASLTVTDPDGRRAARALPVGVVPAMVLTIDTSLGSDTTFQLPLHGTGEISVYWGDGQVDVITNPAAPEHTYAADGAYTISVAGTLAGEPRFGQYSYKNSDSLTGVTSWGELGLTSLEEAFSDATNLTTVPPELPAGVTNLKDTFNFATSFDGDISGWDTSNVTNMHGLFHHALVFNQDVGGWDTRNVTDMRDVFSTAFVFDQDISGWNTSNVTTMLGMFYSAHAFDQDIGGWDTSKVTNMMYMFYDARAFDGNIGAWDTGNVASMDQMFIGALEFDQDLSGWCVHQIPTAPTWFDRDASAWTLPRPNWGAPCAP